MTRFISILQCSFYFLSFVLLSTFSLFGQYPYGQLAGEFTLDPGNATTAYAELTPKVTYHIDSNTNFTTTFSDSVKVLWLFSDGTYSTQNSPIHPFNKDNNAQDMDVFLKSNARYKPSDPIREQIPSLPPNPGISYKRFWVDTLAANENIRLKSSWQPVSGDTIYYIITLQNIASECEKQPTAGTVSFEYPSDTLTILEEIIYQNQFQPTHAILPTNNSPLEYQFSNLTLTDQWYLIVKALVNEEIGLGEQYKVTAAVEMGYNREQESDSTKSICISESDNEVNSTTTRPRDPNNKVVSHEIVYADQGTQDLLFTLNFQNIKGGIAEKVKIFDYFDFAHLDTAGFEIIARSHPLTHTWKANGLEFEFKKINLTSVEAEKQKAISNLNSTKGFVTYRVSLKKPYQVGDIIENQALVEFFDHLSGINAADQVLTNKTITLVKAPQCNSECSCDGKTLNCFCTIILILSIVILLLLLIIFVKKLR